MVYGPTFSADLVSIKFYLFLNFKYCDTYPTIPPNRGFSIIDLVNIAIIYVWNILPCKNLWITKISNGWLSCWGMFRAYCVIFHKVGTTYSFLKIYQGKPFTYSLECDNSLCGKGLMSNKFVNWWILTDNKFDHVT